MHAVTSAVRLTQALQTCVRDGREFVADWLTRWTVNPVAKGSSPGPDGMKDCFSVFSESVL